MRTEEEQLLQCMHGQWAGNVGDCIWEEAYSNWISDAITVMTSARLWPWVWVTEVDEGNAYWSGEAGARPERPGCVIFVGVENGDDYKCGNTASKHLQTGVQEGVSGWQPKKRRKCGKKERRMKGFGLWKKRKARVWQRGAVYTLPLALRWREFECCRSGVLSEQTGFS